MDDDCWEISGSGYARGGSRGMPDYVPLLWSDPAAITFDASAIQVTLTDEPPDEPDAEWVL